MMQLQIEFSGLALSLAQGRMIENSIDREKFRINRDALIQPAVMGKRLSKTSQDVVCEAFLDVTAYTSSKGVVHSKLTSGAVLDVFRGPVQEFLEAVHARHPNEVVSRPSVYVDAIKARSKSSNMHSM